MKKFLVGSALLTTSFVAAAADRKALEVANTPMAPTTSIPQANVTPTKLPPVESAQATSTTNKHAVEISYAIKNEGELRQQWAAGEVYFLPHQLKREFSPGIIYRYKEKDCFDLSLQLMSKEPNVTQRIECAKEVLVKANREKVKYEKIEEFINAAIKCADKKDKECMKKFFTGPLKSSFGIEPVADIGANLVDSWSDKEFIEIAGLLRKGTRDEGNYKQFPPQADGDGMGKRGFIEKANGVWIIVMYLSGD